MRSPPHRQPAAAAPEALARPGATAPAAAGAPDATAATAATAASAATASPAAFDAPAADPAAPSARSDGASAAAAALRVALVIDPDAWIAKLCRSVLGLRGYTVHAAADAAQGLAAAARLHPDVILVDARAAAAPGPDPDSDPHLQAGPDSLSLIPALRALPGLHAVACVVLYDRAAHEQPEERPGDDRERPADGTAGWAGARGFLGRGDGTPGGLLLAAARLSLGEPLGKPFRLADLDDRVLVALRRAEHAARTARRALDPAATHAAPAGPGPGAGAGPGPGSGPGLDPAAYAAGIHGTLDQLGVASLLAMLELERKSGTLALSRGPARGSIACRRGRVTAAALVPAPGAPAQRGIDAVFLMLAFADGRFAFLPDPAGGEGPRRGDAADEINVPTAYLLMEGARRADEARAGQPPRTASPEDTAAPPGPEGDPS